MLQFFEVYEYLKLDHNINQDFHDDHQKKKMVNHETEPVVGPSFSATTRRKCRSCLKKIRPIFIHPAYEGLIQFLVCMNLLMMVYLDYLDLSA